MEIHLPVWGTQVLEDSTCRRATKPASCDSWSLQALGHLSHNYWAHMLHLLKPAHLQHVLHNKSSAIKGLHTRAGYNNPCSSNLEKALKHCNEDPVQPLKKKSRFQLFLQQISTEHFQCSQPWGYSGEDRPSTCPGETSILAAKAGNITFP